MHISPLISKTENLRLYAKTLNGAPAAAISPSWSRRIMISFLPILSIQQAGSSSSTSYISRTAVEVALPGL
jgi:hypothetical protein